MKPELFISAIGWMLILIALVFLVIAAIPAYLFYVFFKLAHFFLRDEETE